MSANRAADISTLEKVERPVKRFLLLIEQPANRELLTNWLTRYYEVDLPTMARDALPDEEYDLCLIDAPMLIRYRQELQALRRKLHPVFFPVVFLTRKPEIETIAQELWQTIDEVIHVPIAQAELRARLELLLRTRQLSLESQRMTHLMVERQQLEAQLEQAQRMESIGFLVSGVAHDFNNLLTSIKSQVQRAYSQLSEEHPTTLILQQLEQRIEQATRLTRQLLSFARGRSLERTQINLNSLIDTIQLLVGSALGPNIKLQLKLSPEAPVIVGNAVQLEQVLMNLCLNARDAMPAGGMLTISTHLIEHHPLESSKLAADRYAQVKITDTGKGMDAQVLSHIFDPFFTTRSNGTGLGLAIVERIIKEHRGWIEADSIPEQGSTFTLSLPLQSSIPAQTEENFEQDKPTGLQLVYSTDTTTGTILIVEDDPDIQYLLGEILRGEGYTVLQANNGVDGLALCREHLGQKALIITDVMIPKMDINSFLAQSKNYWPSAQTLVMSGFTQVYLQQSGLLDQDQAFLQKPFDLDKLLTTVHSLLSKS
ncbi:response regulator [Ktedonosporobacter rubrisoli]|uniref:histidine kinase n=1 Tax=Ktedonosporobacter rubrisoli TaxID=2509675 RepID=A0A4P6JTS7_KTERU|nr:ATP-binding protein [Ktedonosporobacter rubrisoli]QBD78710.1 response regulator [Ktedonosporobacter rubrisoli]